jgi:hypothetical protein
VRYQNPEPKHRHRYEAPPWAAATDLVTETAHYGPDQRVRPALRLLLDTRGLDYECLARASGVSKKHIQNVFEGEETPTPKVWTKSSTGSLLQACALLRHEVRQLQWLLQQQRRANREWSKSAKTV